MRTSAVHFAAACANFWMGRMLVSARGMVRSEMRSEISRSCAAEGGVIVALLRDGRKGALIMMECA